MRRRLCGFILLLLLVSSGYAQDDVRERLIRVDDVGGGSLLIETRHPGVYVEAVTVGTDVAIGVTGMLARARVVQQFVNTLDSCVDAKYVFPLPAGAAVDAYRMRVGGRTIEGEVREREEAKRVFEEARAEGRAASIVERARPNVFSLSLANVGAKETIEVEIEYQATVPFADGVFELRFPTVVAPRYEPASVSDATEREPAATAAGPMPDIRYDPGRRGNPLRLSVDLDPGVPLDSIDSPSHAVDEVHLSGTRHMVSLVDQEQPADRDFVLRWTPLLGREPRAARFSETTADGIHGEMLFILPPDTGLGGVIPKEVVFIIDTSGSMEGPSIAQAKAALHDAVERLRPVDSFEIIEFNSVTRRMFGAHEVVDDRTRAHALGWIDRLRADGGTEMEPALATALDIPILNLSAVRQVVFITDGQVGNEAGLFRFVSSRLGAGRLFVVGIGSAPNENLMRLVAKAGRGTCTFVGRESEVQSKMDALFRKLESPVLTGITIETDEGVVVQPSPVPDLYAGEPLVVTLRSDRAAPRIRVTARGGSLWNDDLSRSVSRETSGISRLVAQREVESLEESVILGAAEEEVKTKVIELALANRLVTKYTAFVAVDRSGPVEGEVCESVPVEVNLPAGWGGIEGGSLPQGGTASRWLLLQGIALLGASLALRAAVRVHSRRRGLAR